MQEFDDRTIMVEETVDLNQVLKDVLDRYLDTTQAVFDFLGGASSDCGKGHVALIMSFVKGADRRWKFFERQVNVYRGALLRRSLFSLKRLTPDGRVRQMKDALALAAEDVELMQQMEMAAIEALGEQVLDRHVRLLENAQHLLQKPAAPALGVGEVRMLLEACQREWGAHRSATDGDGS